MIGIGGSGMSGAAAMLLALRARVSGSDQVRFEGMGKLVSHGAKVSIGHDIKHLDPRLDLVIISAAIPESNPELSLARARGVTIIKYAKLVGLIMGRFGQGMAVAGTHGKTTTSAMAAYLCRACGLKPSFLIGGTSDQLGGNSGLGEGLSFIVEACEFDRSFLHLEPKLATILNIEPDHLDCYEDVEAIVEAFGRFARRVAPDGWLLVNGEDARAREASALCSARLETFGLTGRMDWQASTREVVRGCHRFEVSYQGHPLFSTSLSVPGRHNVADALAAIALTVHAGGDPDDIAKALPGFRGVRRRLTYRGTGGGVTIVDDYAHHPTEISVSLEAARFRYLPKRTWVVFQPHQAARTGHFLDAFAASLADVEEIIIPNVYGAREDDADAVAARSVELVSRICQCGGRARYLPTLAEAAAHVARHAVEGDLVLTMGAGDVWKVADELVERFCEPNRA